MTKANSHCSSGLVCFDSVLAVTGILRYPLSLSCRQDTFSNARYIARFVSVLRRVLVTCARQPKTRSRRAARLVLLTGLELSAVHGDF